MTPTFIITTGRSGTKFMSNMLQRHPDVLSLSGFFISIMEWAFPSAPLDGGEFWRLITTRRPDIENMLRRGIQFNRFRYPFETGRFNLETGTPYILYLTIPQITSDPDGLYAELEVTVPQWPSRPIVQHYRQLFGWLAGRFDKSVVVERSGGSIVWVSELHAAFPDARFILVHRNGPDCAVAMSKSPLTRVQVFRYTAAELIGVPTSADITEDQVQQLPDHLAAAVRGEFKVETLMSEDAPLTWFGDLWSKQISKAATELAKLPLSSWTTVSYESMVSDPVHEFARMARFLGAEPTAEWLQDAASQVDPSRAHTSHGLDEATRAQLEQACAAGTQALKSIEHLHHA